MPDERAALDAEIGRLQADNEKLKAELTTREPAVTGKIDEALPKADSLKKHEPKVADGERKIEIPLPPLEELPSLSLPGEHNRINAACAAAAATGAGCDRQAVQQGLQSFRGLPQRLQWLAVIEGRRIYNDSTATTPESTIAALQAMELPVWLLAGGKNKGCHFDPLAAEIGRHTRGAAFFGTAREELRRCLAAQGPQLPCTAVETILLSPACASTDQFRNFRQRGERFDELIRELADPLNRYWHSGK